MIYEQYTHGVVLAVGLDDEVTQLLSMSLIRSGRDEKMQIAGVRDCTTGKMTCELKTQPKYRRVCSGRRPSLQNEKMINKTDRTFLVQKKYRRS